MKTSSPTAKYLSTCRGLSGCYNNYATHIPGERRRSFASCSTDGAQQGATDLPSSEPPCSWCMGCQATVVPYCDSGKVVGQGVAIGYVQRIPQKSKRKRGTGILSSETSCITAHRTTSCRAENIAAQADFIFHTLSNAHGKFLWRNHHRTDVLCVLLVFPYRYNRLWFHSQSSKRGREHQTSRGWFAALRGVGNHCCRYVGRGSSDSDSCGYRLSDSGCWRCCGRFEPKQSAACRLWHPRWICLVRYLRRNFPRHTRQLQENAAKVSKEKRV